MFEAGAAAEGGCRGAAEGDPRHSADVCGRRDAYRDRAGHDKGAGPVRVCHQGRALLEEVGGSRRTVGETQLWTITNKAIWAHPIHLHGFFFQEVDEKGVPVSPRAWKDTIHVAVDATKRFLVKFDRPGSWMYHCHILDHAEAGLMSTVDVGDVPPPAAEHTH